MIKIWIIIIGGLAQLASCVSRIMVLPIQDIYPALPLATPIAQVRDAAVSSKGDFVVVSGGVNEWEPRTITRIRAGANEGLLSMPGEHQWCLGERLVAAEKGSWWYSRCGGAPPKFLVQFVTSGAPSSPVSVRMPGDLRDARAWLSLEGENPSGVLLSHIDADEQGMFAELVSPHGVETLGAFRRKGALGFGPGIWQGHRLSDGRIALVSIEDDELSRHSAIMLRMMKDGEVVEMQLPFEPRKSYAAIALAVGNNGNLAVVAAESDGRVIGMTVDPNEPRAARPRVFTESESAVLPLPGVRVLWTGVRFAAAWVRAADGVVRLREFDRKVALPTMSVGDDADRSNPLLVVRKAPEGLDLFWSSGRETMWRRLPNRPTGYLMAVELWNLFGRISRRVLQLTETATAYAPSEVSSTDQ